MKFNTVLFVNATVGFSENLFLVFNEHLYKMVYYPNIDYDIVYIT